MKKLSLLALSVSVLLLISYSYGIKEKSVVTSDATGFFVNFARTLNHIHYCSLHDKTPIAYWDNASSYWSNEGYNGSKNVWEYYFEPISNQTYERGDPIRLASCSENFSVFWDMHQYIDNIKVCTPEEKKAFLNITNRKINHYWNAPTDGRHLYNKNFRSFVKKELIDPYIKIKPCIQEKIDSFFSQNMAGKKTIGIHLRGKHMVYPAKQILPYVPVKTILEIANKLADQNTQFFVATDQLSLLKEAQSSLKGKVIFYEDIERSNQPTLIYIPGGEKVHPKLGEDVLIEAQLLSKCDFLVHTISTVSTCVLYFNPTMEHICLY